VYLTLAISNRRELLTKTRLSRAVFLKPFRKFFTKIKRRQKQHPMKKKRTSTIPKIGFLFTIILLCFAGLNISYSIWYDQVDIIVSITTSGGEETSAGTWARMYDQPNNFTYEFTGHNWATYLIHQPTETPVTFSLYADQHLRAGELIIWKNTTHLLLKYTFDAGYHMSASHLHVATTLQDIPQKNGNPTPGKFSYKKDHDPHMTEYTYQLPWKTIWNGKHLFIAAHAEVWIPRQLNQRTFFLFPCDI
jgi:hypothetical protein